MSARGTGPPLSSGQLGSVAAPLTLPAARVCVCVNEQPRAVWSRRVSKIIYYSKIPRSLIVRCQIIGFGADKLAGFRLPPLPHINPRPPSTPLFRTPPPCAPRARTRTAHPPPTTHPPARPRPARAFPASWQIHTYVTDSTSQSTYFFVSLLTRSQSRGLPANQHTHAASRPAARPATRDLPLPAADPAAAADAGRTASPPGRSTSRQHHHTDPPNGAPVAGACAHV